MNIRLNIPLSVPPSRKATVRPARIPSFEHKTDIYFAARRSNPTDYSKLAPIEKLQLSVAGNIFPTIAELKFNPKKLEQQIKARLGLSAEDPRIQRLQPEELALLLVLPELMTDDLRDYPDKLVKYLDQMRKNALYKKAHYDPFIDAELSLLTKRLIMQDKGLRAHGLTLWRAAIDVLLVAKFTELFPFYDPVMWARAGTISNSFKTWKYDTRPQLENKSLFELFGMKPLETKDSVFGGGFTTTPALMSALCQKDMPLETDHDSFKVYSGTIIEMRHGYIEIKHPWFGSLIIRNSSVIFGRDKMRQMAYFSPEPDACSKRREAGLDFDAKSSSEELPDYMNLFENNTAGFQYNITVLLNQFYAFNRHYRSWKYDTEAYDGEKATGYLSPGFKPILNIVNKQMLMKHILKSQAPPPCRLAFVNPEFPAHEVYAIYTPDSDYANDDLVKYITRQPLDASNRFIDFLKQGHKFPFAELVLIDPEAKE